MEIFGIGFGKSMTVLRFDFDPGIDVFRFFCVFLYYSEMYHVFMGPRLGPFCVLLLD